MMRKSKLFSKNLPRYYLHIAGFIFVVDMKYVTDEDVHTQLRNFLSGYYFTILSEQGDIPADQIDYTIYFVAEEELKFTRRTRQNATLSEYFLRIFSLGKKNCYVDYHISIAQMQFLLKSIVQQLLNTSSGFVLHASAVTNGKEAFLFLGTNGAGKSTIVQNLRKMLSPFADDTVAIKSEKGKWTASQFPLEKNKMTYITDNVPLVRGLFFIKKSNQTKFVKMSLNESLPRVVKQIMLLHGMKINMKNLLRFIGYVDAIYVLECQKKPDIKKIVTFLEAI